MKKTWIIRILLLTAYCIPFAFLCVNGDAASGTMLWYVIMAVAFALLCWAVLKTNNITILYIGNAFSYLFSGIAVELSGLEPMGNYFKPFTSYSLITAITIIYAIAQSIFVVKHIRKNRSADNDLVY